MRFTGVVWACLVTLAASAGCSASGTSDKKGSGGGGGGSGGSGGNDICDLCLGVTFIPCTGNGQPGEAIACPDTCAPGVGCVDCYPGSTVCVGNEVHKCSDDGTSSDEVVEVCDVQNGMLCGAGKCGTACEIAAASPSNVGCEFWAADLDQQDGFNDPASAPWGLALSNAGATDANVTIEINEAQPGQALQLSVVRQITVQAGSLEAFTLPTRELDCGTRPNDYASPGTCLSSRAFRVSSSAPIVVYQFNVFENAFSNDASLLLPSSALGRVHRIIGWPAGHPLPVGPFQADRAYITIVGTTPNTQVTVKPSFRIRSNDPVIQQPNGLITATIGPFDVLNLETDDATLQEAQNWGTDLSGSVVETNNPVAVFSGVESTSAPGGLDIPTYPGWSTDDTCCLDHLEEQMFPVESIGKNFVVARSPVRSTSGWREPDVIRFLGVAETATVTTSLPAPYDSFVLEPGDVKTTWAQDDFVATSDKPVMIGQILISNQRVDGPYIGDPSLTVFPPVEQFRTEYIILTPPSWNQNWVVITAEVGTNMTLDGQPANCTTESSGDLLGIPYESRRCPLTEGVHKLSGDKPYGIVAYGYGSAGSYAFAGGADVEPIYTPPPVL